MKITSDVVEANYPPTFILKNENNGTFDGNKRWASYGIGNWIDFKFDESLDIYGIDVAWYRGNERRHTFKIYAGHAQVFNGVSTGNDSVYETYKFLEPISTRNIRIVCYGNTYDQWNEIAAVAFRTEPVTVPTIAAFPDCPDGQHWHQALSKCVEDVVTKPPIIVINDALQTVKHGDRILIDGSNSSDPNGSPLFYEWIQTRGELVMASSLLQPTITFVAPTVDTELVFRLKVTNEGNLYTTKDARIVVRSEIPICPPGQVWSESLKECVSTKPHATLDVDQQKPVIKSKKRVKNT